MNPYVKSAPVRAELHNFKDCIALDEFTVQFRLKAAGPKVLDKLAINFFIQPKHIYDPANITDGYSAAEGALACENELLVSQESLENETFFGSV